MRFRGRNVRGPVLGPTARVVAVVAIAPFLLGDVVALGIETWLAITGRPNELLLTVGGVALWTVAYTLPILGALWLGRARLRSIDAGIRKRRRSGLRLPASVHVARFLPDLGPGPVGVPLFLRPFAHPWSTVALVEAEGVDLYVFELIHGDLRGEPGHRLQRSFGFSLVSCAAFRIDGDMPQVVVRPAGSKRFSLPEGTDRYSTELETFNKSHRILSADPYAASVLVDPRTIDAIRGFDPRFSVEIGGSWVVVHAPRLSAKDMGGLIEATAELARTFPRVAASIYPTASRT